MIDAKAYVSDIMDTAWVNLPTESVSPTVFVYARTSPTAFDMLCAFSRTISILAPIASLLPCSMPMTSSLIDRMYALVKSWLSSAEQVPIDVVSSACVAGAVDLPSADRVVSRFEGS